MNPLLVAESITAADGWSRYSLGVARGLARLGLEPRMLVDRRQSGGAPIGVSVIPCLSSALGALDRPRAILWNMLQLAFHARRADIVHFTVEPYATASLPVGLPPSFLSVHGTYAVLPLAGGRLTRTLYAGALRRARNVICSSTFTSRVLDQKLKLNNLKVIPLGHDLSLDEILHDEDEEPIAGQPIILGVGALKERKGYHTTLRAVALLRERFPGLRYYLVGDDTDTKYVARLRVEITELDLEQHATITGSLSDAELRRHFRQADLFMLNPVNTDQGFEGFGMVYLEANAYSKPVIGSFGCGAEDAIDDGVTGFLAPQGDPAAIADRAAAILSDPRLAARLGAAGRARAERQTLGAVARQYLDLYEQALRH